MPKNNDFFCKHERIVSKLAKMRVANEQKRLKRIVVRQGEWSNPKKYTIDPNSKREEVVPRICR